MALGPAQMGEEDDFGSVLLEEPDSFEAESDPTIVGYLAIFERNVVVNADEDFFAGDGGWGKRAKFHGQLP